MRRRLGALALAAATALLLTWPLARHPTTRLLDDGTLDGFQFTWNLWWVRTALLTGQNPFFTRELFYPDGINLFWHTLCFPAGVLSLPFALLGDGLRTAVLAQNATNGFATMATALAGAALALEVSGHRAAAALAGLCLVANAFHLTQLHTNNIASLYWLIAAVLLWRRLHAKPRWPTAIMLVACLLTVFLAAHEYEAMALALLAFDLAWRLARRGTEPTWLAGGVTALLVTPLLAAALVARLGGPSPEAAPHHMVLWGSAYLSGFVTPPWLPVARGFMGPSLYLGTAPLLLAVAGQALAPRTATRWNVAALLCLLAALGPVLQLGPPGPGFYEHATAPRAWPGWPLPYALASALVPGLAVGRTPWRWVAAARVCVVVAAACGAAALAPRLARAPLLRAIAAAALVAVTLAEAWPHRLPAVPATLPSGYEVLARAPADGAVLELPAGVVAGTFGLFSSLWMGYQTAHGKPLLEGTVARLTGGRRVLAGRPDFHVAAHPEVAWAVLHPRAFRAVYPRAPSRRLAREVRRSGVLVYRSRELRIYRLRPAGAAQS